MPAQSPRQAALGTAASAASAGPDAPVPDEHPDLDVLVGYGVMGVPFETGDYLAFRDWPLSSFGPGYRSVWHRDARGRWTIYADAPPELSCARFVSSAVHDTRTVGIEVAWPTEQTLTIRVDDADLTWTLHLESSPLTRMLTTVAAAMPRWAWHSDAIVRMVGATSGPLLRAGRIRLAGVMPNRQGFQVAPTHMDLVRDCSAAIRGRDLGAPAPIVPQVRIGEVPLPQRGIFYAHTTGRYRTPAASLPGETPPATTIQGYQEYQE